MGPALVTLLATTRPPDRFTAVVAVLALPVTLPVTVPVKGPLKVPENTPLTGCVITVGYSPSCTAVLLVAVTALTAAVVEVVVAAAAVAVAVLTP